MHAGTISELFYVRFSNNTNSCLQLGSSHKKYFHLVVQKEKLYCKLFNSNFIRDL